MSYQSVASKVPLGLEIACVLLATEISRDTNTRNALIVEDEVMIALALEHQLKTLGWNVCHKVRSAEIAILIPDQMKVDLIFMDIRLEGHMDGIEAARIILEKHSIPIVMMSAYGNDDVLNRVNELKPFSFLEKPIAPQTITNTISQVEKLYY